MSNNLELGTSGLIMQSNQIKPQKMFQSCLSNRLKNLVHIILNRIYIRVFRGAKTNEIKRSKNMLHFRSLLQYVLAFLLLGFLLPSSFPDQTSAQVSGYSTQYREDYNGDGEVSVADVISLIMMIRTAGYIQQADYNNNGKCDIMDAIALLINIVRDKLTPVQAEPAPVELDPVQIVGPLVVSSNWPECTDLVGWIHDIFRLDGVENSSETRKGICFYTWLRLFNRVCYGGMQQAYEGLPNSEEYVSDAHKNLFVYGWGYCDTHSRIAEAAWQELTGDETSAYRVCVRNPSGGYHTMFRLRLDGNYGAFDARFGYYLIDRDSPDARVLDWDEVGVDSNFIRNESFENRCKPFFEFPTWEKASALRLEPVYWERESDWVVAGRPINQVFASPKHKIGTKYHDMNWCMPRGTTIKRYWNNSGRKWYIPLNRKSDFLPSGRFYRVTEGLFEGNWPRYDPNYQRAKPYLDTVPRDEGYPDWMAGDRTIGQAWGKITYEAELARPGLLDALVEGSNLAHQSRPPYLLPLKPGVPAEAVFDFYCPYILVDGLFNVELLAGENDEVSLELRTLLPKPRNAEQPDVWSDWIEIASGAGSSVKEFSHSQYAAGGVSIHGKYRFQLRLKALAATTAESVGLKKLEFLCHFENGIMSIPQLLPGENKITFKLNDQQQLRAPVQITYSYQTEQGPKSHTKTLQPEDFENNQAIYSLNVPDLIRCDSLEIRY